MDREKNGCFKPNNKYLHTAMWVIGSAEYQLRFYLLLLDYLPIQRIMNQASTVIGVVSVREKVYWFFVPTLSHFLLE